MNNNFGKLYLVPAFLGATTAEQVIPAGTLEIVRTLRHFVVENVRTARRMLSKMNMPVGIDELTFVELDKLMYSPRSNSEIAEFANRWNTHDIYSMFCNTYSELLKSRSETTDLRSRIIYLISLMQFNPIPNLEVSHEF